MDLDTHMLLTLMLGLYAVYATTVIWLVQLNVPQDLLSPDDLHCPWVN